MKPATSAEPVAGSCSVQHRNRNNLYSIALYRIEMLGVHRRTCEGLISEGWQTLGGQKDGMTLLQSGDHVAHGMSKSVGSSPSPACGRVDGVWLYMNDMGKVLLRTLTE